MCTMYFETHSDLSSIYSIVTLKKSKLITCTRSRDSRGWETSPSDSQGRLCRARNSHLSQFQRINRNQGPPSSTDQACLLSQQNSHSWFKANGENSWDTKRRFCAGGKIHPTNSLHDGCRRQRQDKDRRKAQKRGGEENPTSRGSDGAPQGPWGGTTSGPRQVSLLM